VHRVELKLEADIGLPYANDESIDELDTVLATLVPGLAAELCRRDPWVAGKTIHTARLPIPRVAGIDDHDTMQVATKPERGREPRGPAANNGNVKRVTHVA